MSVSNLIRVCQDNSMTIPTVHSQLTELLNLVEKTHGKETADIFLARLISTGDTAIDELPHQNKQITEAGDRLFEIMRQTVIASLKPAHLPPGTKVDFWTADGTRPIMTATIARNADEDDRDDDDLKHKGRRR